MGTHTRKDIHRNRHGKCTPCKVTFHWVGLPSLRDALCPKCGGKLTLGLLKAKGRHDITRPATAQPGAEA